MSEAKSPLFNRTYLKIIIWIVAIAIVLLTAGQNKDPDFIRIKKRPDAPLYYVSQDKSPYLQLHFLLRTGVAINSDQQLLQTLLQQQIEQQLAGLAMQPLFTELEARIRTEASADRITLVVTLPAKQSGAHDLIRKMTEALLQQLNIYQPDSALEQRWAHLEAEQYLKLKEPESLLLSRFGNQISSPASVHPLQRFADFYRSSTAVSAMTLTLQGPDAEPLAETLAPLLSKSSNAPIILPVAIAPTRIRLEPVGNQTYQLWGIALPGRQQEDFVSELLAVRALQQLLQQPDLATSRLIWKSLDKQGYLAMILHGPQIRTDTDLSKIMEQLQAQLDDELLDNTRAALQKSFHTQMEQTENQLSMLDTVAFYELPADYLQYFEKSLVQTGNDKIRQKISSFLSNARHYQLILPAY